MIIFPGFFFDPETGSQTVPYPPFHYNIPDDFMIAAANRNDTGTAAQKQILRIDHLSAVECEYIPDIRIYIREFQKIPFQDIFLTQKVLPPSNR